MPSPSHPPLPTHDPEQDGNRFDWIISAASKVRAERKGLDMARWEAQEAQARAIRKLVADGEAKRRQGRAGRSGQRRAEEQPA